MTKISDLVLPEDSTLNGIREYLDSGIETSVISHKIRRKEVIRDKKRRWNWVKNNQEMADYS